jgi:membrane protein DedA with SNARE-associated domain
MLHACFGRTGRDDRQDRRERMNAWNSAADALALFFQEYGIVVVSLLLFLKSAGLPIPLPGDLFMLVIGSVSAQQGVPLGIAWVSFSVAIFSGVMVLFAVIRHYGRRRVSQYGHFVGLTDERIEQAEGQIRRRGWRAVAVGRLVPGVRLATAVAAATFDVRPTTFATAAAVSAMAEVGVCLVIGATLGPSIAERVEEEVPLPAPVGQLTIGLILVIAVIAVVRLAITVYRHDSRLSKV